MQGDWNAKIGSEGHELKCCPIQRDDMDWEILIKEDTGC